MAKGESMGESGIVLLEKELEVLKKKRAALVGQLDTDISELEQSIGQIRRVLSRQGGISANVHATAPIAPAPEDGPYLAFERNVFKKQSVIQATLLYLEIVGEFSTVRDMAEAFVVGGMKSKMTRGFPDMIRTALRRRGAKNGIVKRSDGKWGLAKWAQSEVSSELE
jgi:hypothetical protein